MRGFAARLCALVFAIAALLSAGIGTARARELAVGGASDAGVEALLKHVGTRFWLKTQIRLRVAETGADLLVAELAPGARPGRGEKAVFKRGEAIYAVRVAADASEQDAAGRFLDWLVSPAGVSAIESFAAPDGAAFSTDIAFPEVVIAEPEAAPEQVRLGEELAYRHCGRCHVVGERNRYGGIGSTPSFRALRNRAEWRDQFDAFWIYRPHPAFSQIDGVTEPFDPAAPPAAHPLEMTIEEVEAVTAYVSTLEPKDLGAPLKLD